MAIENPIEHPIIILSHAASVDRCVIAGTTAIRCKIAILRRSSGETFKCVKADYRTAYILRFVDAAKCRKERDILTPVSSQFNDASRDVKYLQIQVMHEKYPGHRGARQEETQVGKNLPWENGRVVEDLFQVAIAFNFVV